MPASSMVVLLVTAWYLDQPRVVSPKPNHSTMVSLQPICPPSPLTSSRARMARSNYLPESFS
jgi:hypothetical protein